ncbi:MAG: biotin--[acetyl-CoA-carboxylase] ligase [Dehalococcoidia bacterium]|nr:biotin--[acetyl-CoA-carboxylase] ligase [Dehalococcoidia bacterium]
MPFDHDRYQALRRSQTVGVKVAHLEETGSTMDDARAGAEAGRAAGTAYVAASQRAGRGRMGRSWVSEPGAGLWVTYHLRARQGAPLLSLAGGLAVAEALEVVAGLRCELKWPNDVQHGGRKISGVLAEARPAADGVTDVFLGIGINLRTPSGLPEDILAAATSVEQEGRPAPSREALLAGLSSALEVRAGQAERDSAGLVAGWRARLNTLGRRVRLSLPDGSVVEGDAVDITADGALVIEADGERRTFTAGDVTNARTVEA